MIKLSSIVWQLIKMLVKNPKMWFNSVDLKMFFNNVKGDLCEKG